MKGRNGNSVRARGAQGRPRGLCLREWSHAWRSLGLRHSPLAGSGQSAGQSQRSTGASPFRGRTAQSLGSSERSTSAREPLPRVAACEMASGLGGGGRGSAAQPIRVTVTDGPLQFEGSKDFRLRVVLAVLARRPVVIERIRSKDESPGVRGEAPAAGTRPRAVPNRGQSAAAIPCPSSLRWPVPPRCPSRTPITRPTVSQTMRLACFTCWTK